MTDAGLTVSVLGNLKEKFEESELKLEIKNNTEYENPFFSITLPSELFVDDIKKFQIFDSSYKDVWEGEHEKISQDNNCTTWLIRPPLAEDVRFGTIKLHLFFETREIGPYTLKIGWDLGDDDDPDHVKGEQSANVAVLMSGGSPDVKRFRYNRIVEGASAYVQLAWETDPASKVEIYRGERKLSPAPKESFGSKAQNWEPQDRLKLEGGLEIFRLEATNTERTVSSWHFLKSNKPGWHRKYGELLCLVKQSNDALYGVLAEPSGKAALRKFAVEFDDIGVLAKDFNVPMPDAMRTSPGAFFDNAIWLVGGSQVDPGECSNEIWCYQPFEKKAHSFTANWPARMGHALVVFQDRLWILGGLDANGNALDDVWVYGGMDTFNKPPNSVLQWTSGQKLPEPVCQPSVAAFEDGAGASKKERLWLTGGADSPWGKPQEKTYCLELASKDSVSGTWHKVEGPGDAEWAAQMFAGALCVGRSEGQAVLYWLITAKTNVGGLSTIKSSMFQIRRDTSWNATATELYGSLSVDKRWPIEVGRGGSMEPFRLTAVAFKNFVVVYSLFYRASMPYFAYLLKRPGA